MKKPSAHLPLFSPWIHRGIILMIILLTGVVWSLVIYITLFAYSDMVIEFQFTPQQEARVIDDSNRIWNYGWVSLLITLPSLSLMYIIHCYQSISMFMRHIYSYWLGSTTILSLILLIIYLSIILSHNR